MVDLKMMMALNESMKRESGQIGLIVLLIMVVVTTIAVSVSTRSVSELRISRQEQESTRSLDLAESGIEQLLSQTTLPTTPGQLTIAGKTVDYSVTANTAIGSTTILQGHTLELDMTGVNNLNFNMTSASTPPTTCFAIAVALISDSSPATLSREVYKNVSTCTMGNISSIWNPAVGIPVASKKMVRIKALYGPVTLNNVSLGGTPNTIYHTINATSQMEDGTTRTVQVNKFPGSLPSIFDYVLFSGTSLEKN